MLRATTFSALCLSLVACGGGTSHPDASMQVDAFVGHDSAGNPVDAFVPPVDTGPTGTDAGCSSVSTLHPPHAGATDTIFCPFGVGDAGASLYCVHGTQHCCEPASGAGTCNATATPCGTGDTDWQCQDAGDCGAGMVCCGSGTLVIATPPCGNYATGFHGTHCATSCNASTEIQMCSANTGCSGGQMCTPFRAKGAQVGGCH